MATIHEASHPSKYSSHPLDDESKENKRRNEVRIDEHISKRFNIDVAQSNINIQVSKAHIPLIFG